MEEDGLGQYQAYAYQAYVLRLWKDGAETPWRASLEAIGYGTSHHFADLTQLIQFLQTLPVTPASGAEEINPGEDTIK